MTRKTTLGLAARAQAAHDIVRAVGPLGALTVLPRWLVRREFVVFAMPLHEAVPGPPPHGLRLAPLTETELPELERLHPAMTEAEVRRRWREGQECDVGWVGSHAAYYQWLTTGPVLDPYLDRTIVPGPGDFFGVELRTHPRFQRLGIARWVATFTMQRAVERGLRRRLFLVATWNRPSLLADWGADVERLGTVGYWSLGGRRRYFATGAVRVEGTVLRIGATHHDTRRPPCTTAW